MRRQRKAEAQEARAAEKAAREQTRHSEELRSYSSLMQVGTSRQLAGCCKSDLGGTSCPEGTDAMPTYQPRFGGILDGLTTEAVWILQAENMKSNTAMTENYEDDFM